MITFAKALKRFKYDPETGDLIHRVRNSNGRVKPGDKVGYLNSRGYLRLCITNEYGLPEHYGVAHICWLLYYGEHVPEGKILDHRNRVRSDNRIENLRCVDYSESNLNRSIVKEPMISWESKIGKWRVRIRGKHIGVYRTKKEAIRARDDICNDIEGRRPKAISPTPATGPEEG